MNTLTIDIGNSLIKVDCWDEGDTPRRLLEKEETTATEIAGLARMENAAGIIVASVRKGYETLLAGLNEMAGCPVVDFNQEEIGVYRPRIEYEGKIGADRVAAFLGAEELMPGCGKLVIDAGTAMTLDVVDPEGRFRGGNISTGLATRLRALNVSTSLLPEVSPVIPGELFGHDTLGALRAGAANGVKGEILYTLTEASNLYGITRVAITGGDMESILSLMGEAAGQWIADPGLVGRGLNAHLRKYCLMPEKIA